MCSSKHFRKHFPTYLRNAWTYSNDTYHSFSVSLSRDMMTFSTSLLQRSRSQTTFFKFHLPGRSIPVESLPSGYGWLISASSLPRDRRPQTACLHPVLSSVVSHFILMGISGSPFSSRVATHPWKYLNFFLLNSRPWKYLKTGQAGAWRVLEFHFTAPWKSLNSPSQTMRYQQLR